MQKQKGITLIGFIVILIVAGFFALMAMKLVPSYIEYFGVVKAMNQVAADPDAGNMSLREIRANLNFKASFQYVDDATLGTGRNSAVKVVRNEGHTDLVVNYDKRVPFIYNIDFLLHFHKTVPLRESAG